ncbi:MAG TPA: sugar ABC transporter substrate-binding protein [Rectinemataceae bacterium]|nr:sugar ABC transporter substrate-binding protein [Rectinemataceae bacterium]
MKKFIVMTMMVVMVIAGASAQSGGKVKLKMILWDLNQTTYMQPMVDAYIAQHPNVSIEYINIPANDYGQKLAVMLAGGDASDIISVKDIPMYASMVAKKQIEPLNAYIARDKVDLEQYSGVTDEISVDKSIYALPFRSDIWILYYNKDIFDKAKVPYPTNDMTWDQYAALARQVASGQGVDRVYGSHYHTWRSTIELPTVQDGKHSIIATDYSYMKPYYEMVLGMQKDKTVMDFASLKVGNMHYSGLFYNEQIAMMPMGSWFIGTLISKIKDGTADMKWGIARYPHPAGVPAGTTAGTITSLSVNAKSANKDTAWDFVRFFCGPEGADILAKLGSLPAIRNQQVLDSIKKIDGYPQDKTSAEALVTKTVRLELPMHAKVAVIEKILNEQHELIMTGSVSIDQGLADMGRRVKEVLAQ